MYRLRCAFSKRLAPSWPLPSLTRSAHNAPWADPSLSYVIGPTNPPLSTKTLPEYFHSEVLARHAARPALVCRQERPKAHGGPPSPSSSASGSSREDCLAWNFEEFDAHIQALARGLVGMGVEKGDRVGVVMGNTSAYAMLQWACATVGAVLVTINPAYRLQELVGTLNLVGVKHLFVVPSIRSSAYVHMLAHAFPALAASRPGNIQEPALPVLKNLVVIDNEHELRRTAPSLDVKSAIEWREIMMWRESEASGEARKVRMLRDGLQKDEVMNLQFTSGTTGYPKAVSLTHHNLLNNALSVSSCMRLTEDDILWNLAAWSRGACIVYPSPIFDPRAVVDAVTHERCTALHGVPTHFLAVLTEIERRGGQGDKVDVSRLRTGIAAGSSIPIELMKRLIEKLNLKELTNAYAETSPVSFQTTPDDPLLKRVETVGRVQPHARAKLVDREGRVVRRGVPGEICVAGYLVQKGYWGDPAQTQLVMKHEDEEGHEREQKVEDGDEGGDGGGKEKGKGNGNGVGSTGLGTGTGTVWMHTGDEGVLDEEGYLRVVGRIKDIIIRGGENLFPVQIENALTAHPLIREAAAVAVPDERYGEVVGAWIVRETGNSKDAARLSRGEVRRAVTQDMNPQNGPAWVWFTGEDGNPDELPKTASGKVMKHVLREWSRELAGRGVGRV